MQEKSKFKLHSSLTVHEEILILYTDCIEIKAFYSTLIFWGFNTNKYITYKKNWIFHLILFCCVILSCAHGVKLGFDAISGLFICNFSKVKLARF
jgi:hypothetical protein